MSESISRVAITIDMLPIGPVWEDDMSCWKADVDPMEPKGWRWHPMNWTAFAKGEPQGEMSEFPLETMKPLAVKTTG